MATVRAHIVLTPEILLDLDELVGPRERSSFILRVLTEELRRRKFTKFLNAWTALPDEAWDPELVRLGSDEWVRRLRKEDWPGSEDESAVQPVEPEAEHEASQV